MNYLTVEIIKEIFNHCEKAIQHLEDFGFGATGSPRVEEFLLQAKALMELGRFLEDPEKIEWMQFWGKLYPKVESMADGARIALRSLPEIKSEIRDFDKNPLEATQ